jgi:hypothetical protein
MEEVAAVAHLLTQTGIISALEEHVRFARARFGTYDTIDAHDRAGELCAQWGTHPGRFL